MKYSTNDWRLLGLTEGEMAFKVFAGSCNTICIAVYIFVEFVQDIVHCARMCQINFRVLSVDTWQSVTGSLYSVPTCLLSVWMVYP